MQNITAQSDIISALLDALSPWNLTTDAKPQITTKNSLDSSINKKYGYVFW